MSDQDQDSSQWQLGMQLPSRKETHGRKKKSDRKLDKQEKQPQATTESPTATPPVDAEGVGTPVVRPVPPKKERVRYIEAIPEDPRYAAPMEEGTPPAPDKQEAFLQLQAYWNEAAATATLTRVDEEHVSEESVSEKNVSAKRASVKPIAVDDVSQQTRGRSEDEDYLRELIAGTYRGQDAFGQTTGQAVDANFSVAEMATVEAVSAIESITPTDEALEEIPRPAPDDTADPTPDPIPEEEDSAPVFAKWKIALLIVLTPIVLVVILAWGKLAYVHQVPAFVQQQVPAYQQGKGFLILKPWWFGPPIFTLDHYERTDGEDFVHWKIQLNDYAAVVDDPTVLYTFPDDILK